MKIFYYLSIALLIIACIVSGIIFGGIGVLIGIGAALFFILITVIDQIRYKKRAFCKNCKKKFDFASEVTYHSVARKVNTYSFNSKNDSTHQLKSLERQKLRFDCTCSACGQSKQFTDWYPVRQTYYDGQVKDFDVENDIERYMTTGAEKFSTCLLIIGIAIALIVGSLFINGVISVDDINTGLGGTSATDSDEQDPANYYGTYYAIDSKGVSYELVLESNKTYQMTQEDPVTGETRTYRGTFAYKNASNAQKLMENHDYAIFDALFLQMSDDKYIVLWMDLLSSEKGLIINTNGVKLTKEKPNSTPSFVDPKNYYGTYYGFDKNSFTEYEVTVTQNGYTFKTSNLIKTNSSSNTYKYLPPEYLSGLSNPKYTTKNALVCDTEENGIYITLWIHETATGVALEFDSIDVTLYEDGMTLAEYMAQNDGQPKTLNQTFQYSATNKVVFNSNGTARFTFNGSAKTYNYFYASTDYVRQVLKRSVSADGCYVLYLSDGSYHLFTINDGDLYYGDALFAQQ